MIYFFSELPGKTGSSFIKKAIAYFVLKRFINLLYTYGT